MSWIGDDMRNPNTRVWIVATFLSLLFLVGSNGVWMFLYMNKTTGSTPEGSTMSGFVGSSTSSAQVQTVDPDNGWHDGYTGDDAVYVTPSGTKYHTSRSCHYLEKSPRVLTVDPAEARNRVEKCSSKQCKMIQ